MVRGSLDRIATLGFCSEAVFPCAMTRIRDRLSILFSGPVPNRGHEVMPNVSVPGKDVKCPRLSVRGGIVAGFRVAFIGSVFLALLECLARVWVLRDHFEASEWPWGLIIASYGKIAMTHLLLWCSILPVCGLLYSLVRGRSDGALAEPFLLAVMLTIAGLFLMRPALLLATVKSPFLINTGKVLCLMVALACYALSMLLYRRVGRQRFKKSLRITWIVAILLHAGSAYAFYESPFLQKASVSDRAAGEPVIRHPGRPNVLWIDLDTVRADHMSCYGYHRKTTPFLEKWASGSIVFDRVVADGMWTVPTHASMFTGKSVRQHGMDWGHLRLDEGHATIAERLDELGYRSLFLSNNTWLTPETGLVKGFQGYHNVYQLNRIDYFSLELLMEQWGVTPFLPWMNRDFGAKLTNHLAGQWLDKHVDHGEPLFLFVNYMEAHIPYSVPKEYRRMYMNDRQLDRSYDLHRTVYGSLINAMEFRYNIGDRDFLDTGDRDILRLQYDSSVRYLDDRAKELIGFFEHRGILKDTLVIITSDHGEYLGAHEMWTHTTGLYDELTHVALILHEPERQKGLRVGTPVQQSDLYVSIMKAIGERFYDNTNPYAQDLFETAASRGKDRIAVSQSFGAGPRTRSRLQRSRDPVMRNRAVGKIAVTDGRYKYIAANDGKRELYDLQMDPGESRNIIRDRPVPADRLSTFLAGWLKKVPRYLPQQRRGPDSLKPDTIDSLKGLGYIGSEH